MEIKDILSQLGLDLSNPEARRGAIEAIDAILTSRTPVDVGDLGGGSGGSGANGNETEVELDPDLLQPSSKQAPSGGSDDDIDIEVEDEENILGQIKQKEPEEPTEPSNSNSNDSESNNGGTGSQSASSTDSAETSDDSTEQDNASYGSEEETGEHENSAQDEEETSMPKNKAGSNEDNIGDSETTNETEDDPDGFESTEENENSDEVDFADDDESGTEEGDFEAASKEAEDSEYDEDTAEETFDEEDFDFDEDELIDDELKNSVEDTEIKTKHNARKIKRERTLAAAKKALADAQAKKISPALIRELEKSIEALEALTEAAAKSLKDISDEEFNRLINRVFDAIDACGGSDLTFTSEEEREARVKEIKSDLAKAETQAELSAEDVAKIRAETQAVKAREKEAAKYSPRSAGSFKGFQEFLSSLYKAIALQVSNEETRDDTWSAISRRNSGAGVLRQGQKINDLPDKRIPIIDFYFDQSASWSAQDLKVGMKAVSQLADMEEKGQIKLNIFYFADEVSETPTRGGTSGWNKIVKNVIATQATNVVVMTDDDMQDWWRPQDKPPLRYTVPGYVWYLWKDGSNAPRLPQDLKGRGGVQQFSFNAGDV